ncbi:carboxymuconolactone decarboxylase family protein [Leifsonia sp. H3M29-4]|uniref:carboxymuconolactone decarboxylase family protein n=1 Tax=Salinibacterium metalliresistens TaxID=3031321 RepID=UPI0023DB613C|nr:carboxymuconolactone decarboxylase family protein [Salinibacterium metalliresistens]MDF1480000.1 carboxymuconolactone decarboxylase family protein [Salinibacterium metalliresistens]
MPLTPRQQEIKDEFERSQATWDDGWQSILEIDPEFLATYTGFASVPRRQRHLDAKAQAFVALTVDAATTNLHAPGVRRHIEAALAAGASRAEIMEVLECTATLGIHAMNLGVPVLVEVLGERGIRTAPAPLDAEQERIKAEFTRDRGYWNATWDEMLELDPALFEAYTAFSSHPWRHGSLSPKMREFIYIAFDTSSTHLYRVGLKLHIENALGYGASVHEILEVMEIASLIGINTVTVGAAILRELAPEA